VIGGGIGGIATAWHLARRGVRAVVLEAFTVASGATGRNGGFFIAGVAPAYDESCRLWGRPLAIRRHLATLAAQAEMLGAASQVGARQEFRLTGVLRVAMDADEAVRLRSHHSALLADGFQGSLVGPDALPVALQRPERLGLFTAHDGSVQPARWVRALAEDIQVYEGTRVLEPPTAEGAGVRVETAQGTVLAGYVVVAADGGLSALLPSVHRVRPRRLNMLATGPARPGLLPVPIYARDGYEYAQQLPSGRVTLGGFSDLDGEASWTQAAVVSAPVQDRLTSYLRDELGVFAPVTHRWAGIVGYADDPVPTCGPVPGSDGRILALGGYNGTGHVQAWVAARVAADLVATGTSVDADLYVWPN
jgi:glycine/D-amino acid oxidase-like deaminating enzyme